MSTTGFILRLLTVGAIVAAVNIAYGQGYLRGYEKRVAEQEDSRKYVSGKMKEMNFCRWLAITRVDEDCRAERVRTTPKDGER